MITIRVFIKILLLLLIFESMSAHESNPTTIPGESVRESETLRIAWMVYRDREDRREDFDALEIYLSDKIGKPVAITTIENYNYRYVREKMTANYDPGERVDITFFTPYTYVLAHQENTDIKAFLTYKLEDGEKDYRCYFVWEQNSGSFETVLQQLRNRKKRLAIVNQYSTSGYLWPYTWLKKEYDIDIDRDSIKTYESKGHLNSLEILRNNPDIIAAAVWEVDYNKFLRDRNLSGDIFQYKEIIPPIPNDPLAIRGGFTIEEENKIKDAFLGMNKEPDGKEILRRNTFEGIASWDLTDDTAYNPVRNFKGEPFPAKSLRLQVVKPTNVTMVHTFTRKLEEAFSDGWFKLETTDCKDVDICLGYNIKRGVDSVSTDLRVQVVTNDGTIDKKITFTRKNLTALVQATSNYLKQLFPLEGYISETDSNLLHPGIIVKLTKEQGIKKYFPVEIIKNSWTDGQPIHLKTIYAYVSDVNSCQSCLTPFSESDSQKIELNVFDNIFYQARILGPEIPPDQIIVKPIDVKLSKEGDFVVDFSAEIYENDPEPNARKSGLGLFVKTRSSGLVLNSKRLNTGEGRIYIAPGKSRTKFSIALSNALKDKITVGLIHPQKMETIKEIWFTMVWRFFTWAFLGGIIGGLIKFVGTLNRSQPGFKPRLVKIVVDIFFGIVVGGALLLILLLIPSLVGLLKTLTPYVNGTAGRLVIGIIGGIIGAPGLSSLVIKKISNPREIMESPRMVSLTP
jgi:phosphate/phosphite/phosphonate ABC transporter binding protein